MTKARDPEIQGKTGADMNGISRRACLGGAALIVGAGATCMMSTSAAAKTSQADAKYQEKPQGDNKCSGCAQFQPPDACKVVDGKISPEGWCQLYTPKAG